MMNGRRIHSSPLAITATLILLFVVAALPASGQTTVTYTQQTEYLSATFTHGTAGAFNNSGAEIGMYANSGGNKEVAVWRNLRTAGYGTGSARNLQVGDRFTITASATSAFGGIGFSLNSGSIQGESFANRTSGSRLFFQEVGTAASWEVNSESGTGGYTTLDYNVSSTRADNTFEVVSEVVFDQSNTYTGTTNINVNARLVLGAAGVIPDASNLTLSGAALRTGSTTGFSETAGTLNLAASSTIDFGTGSHTLAFAASNGVTWTAATSLTVTV